jgi:sugar phosphate isomerase/epimerase
MAVKAMELALVFWAEASPDAQLKELKGFGLRACQLGVPPALDCAATAGAWKSALEREGIAATSAVCSFEGEDYANLAKVHETVGFTAPGYAKERIERMREVSTFAAELGLTALSCHIGFIPEDGSAPLYTELLAIARELCDLCAKHGQDLVLETGQETAGTLLRFLADVERPNIKVNFDPANIVLYGSGDPLEALSMLRGHVLSVHCKDGVSPKAVGELGHEVALGDGEVDMPGFLKMLKEMNYRGLLAIEREEPDTARRKADVELAVKRLHAWTEALA